MAAPPAFQFYASDWAHSVSALTLEERGAYITLLAWSWEHGPVPNDMKRIAAILGTHIGAARRVCVEVLKKWNLREDGGWVSPRLESIRAKRQSFTESKSEHGKRGGQNRWRISDEERDKIRGYKASRSQRLSEARRKGQHSEDEWNEMLAVYEHSCLKCGTKEESSICKDHIVPIFMGGDDSILNIQPLCRSCNAAKGTDQTDHRVNDPRTPSKWLAQLGVKQDVSGDFEARSVNKTPSSPISDLRSPDPLRKERSEGLSARETPVSSVPVAWRKPGNHDMHASCGRVCVPWGLHGEFIERLGGADAGDRLKAWYPTVLAKYDGRPIGDDLFVFWRNEFAAWVGTVSATPKPVHEGKTARSARAFHEVGQAMRGER